MYLVLYLFEENLIATKNDNYNNIRYKNEILDPKHNFFYFHFLRGYVLLVSFLGDVPLVVQQNIALTFHMLISNEINYSIYSLKKKKTTPYIIN